MGGDVSSTFKGEPDVGPTNLINDSTEKQFDKFLAELEANGVIDPSERKSKYDLIVKLSELKVAEKEKNQRSNTCW